GLDGGGGVDGFERGGELLAVGVGGVAQAGADQVHHAGLHGGGRPDRLDRLGQAGQAVAAGDQHVTHAPVTQLSTHRKPEFGALACLHPDAQHVLDPVEVDPDDDVGGLVAHVGAVAHLHHQRVDVDDRIDLVQGPVLPGPHLV